MNFRKYSLMAILAIVLVTLSTNDTCYATPHAPQYVNWNGGIVTIETYSVSDAGAYMLTIPYMCNEKVTATSNSNWLKITSLENGYVKVSVASNNSATRTAKITFKSKTGRKATCSVSQPGAVFKIKDAEKKVSEKEGSITLKYTNNVLCCGNSVRVASDCSWIAISYKRGSSVREKYNCDTLITISYSANKGSERTGIVTISSGKKKANITVHQNASKTRVLGIRKTCISMSQNKSSYIISYCGNQVPQVATNKSWLKATADKKNIYVKAVANKSDKDRKAIVSLTSGKKTVKITVTQEGTTLSVSRKNINVSKSGNNLSLDLKTNCKLTIYSNVKWIKPAVTTIPSSMKVNVTVNKNNKRNKRRGYIYLKSSSGLVTKILITQK